MARRRTAEATSEAAAGSDVFDEQIALRQQEGAPALADADRNANPADSTGKHTAAFEKKQYMPPADPFGFENIKGEGNRVRLLKSEGHQAWVIRFEKSPNEMEGYSKDNPHPVIQMLKDEGYRWGFDDGDGKGGWGKRWTGDPYGTDHMDARKVLSKAAEMIGAMMEHGQSVA